MNAKSFIEGRFQVRQLLGEGGTGLVYRAYDRELDSEVALKVLRSELRYSHAALQSFTNEFYVLRELRHKGIIEVYEFFDEHLAISMQYIEGDCLATLLGAQRTPSPFALLHKVAQALAFAHRLNVIHRDIKPSNVIVRSSDAEPVLIDFGTARFFDETLIAGSRIGSPPYMAPEYYARGEASVQSDIYSFGVLCTEVLTGERPFQGKSVAALGAAHLFHDLPEEVLKRHGLPGWLRTMILICLEKNPKLRYGSFDEIEELFDDKHSDESTPTSRQSLIQRVWKRIVSH